MIFSKILRSILGFLTLFFTQNSISADPPSVKFGGTSAGSECLYSSLFPTANCFTGSASLGFDPLPSFGGSPLLFNPLFNPLSNPLSNPFGSFAPGSNSVGPFSVSPPQVKQDARPPRMTVSGPVAVPAALRALVPAPVPAGAAPVKIVERQSPPVEAAAGTTTSSVIVVSGKATSDVSAAPQGQVRTNSPGTTDVMKTFGGARGAPPVNAAANGQVLPQSSGEKVDIMKAFEARPSTQSGGAQNPQMVGPAAPVTKVDIMGAFQKPKPMPPPPVPPTGKAGPPALVVQEAPIRMPEPVPVVGPTDANPDAGKVLPPYEFNNGAVSFPVSIPGKLESQPLDAGQLLPQTPLLPTEKNRKTLESVCPDCVDPNYQTKFKSFQDIKDRMPGVDSVLRKAAHNMMKIVHMRCDANDVFVPGDYVTNLVYCGGKSCDRMGSKATDTYFPEEIEKFKRDQVYGDVYRVPLPKEVANTRVSDAKSDTRTCQDLHDRPFMFHVGGRATYINGAMDPFDYRAQRALTDAKLNLFDCASTIDAVFAAAGLKFSSKDKTLTAAYSKSTSALVSLANAGAKDNTSCIAIPEFKADDSIRSGDVFVIHRNINGKRQDMGHALMFDDVKEDPFNLAGITNSEDCRTKIEPSKFRFSILQSSGTVVDRQVFEKFKGIDLSIEHHFDKFNAANVGPCTDYSDPGTCDFRARFEDWGAQVIQMARKACYAKTNPQKSVKASEPLQSRDGANVNGKEVPVAVSGVLFRHKGATEACSFAKPPEILGAKCVASCLEK